jgi:hypothetical protein
MEVGMSTSFPFIPILFAVVLVPCLASAKRAVPTKVEPVIYDGVRYVAPNGDGRRGYIQAWDVQTNKKLWELTVFTNRTDPKLEEDVQWVFIKALNARDDTLIVISESGKAYKVDLNTKAITESSPGHSEGPKSAEQLQDVPREVERAIINGRLAKDYELSFHVKPLYLRGDFNGDAKADVAVLVKQHPTGKLGIAIIHGGTDKVTILGAGTPIGNGSDDFEWMDSWKIQAKDHATDGTSVPKLRGDALLVNKSEAASALIYWNGKRYVWLQQGD